MLSIEAQRIAAKFGRDTARPPDRFHPLACHMADVAAVASALWATCLPLSMRRQVAEGLGLDEDEAGRWVAFIAGLHDLGKASRPFQRKDPHHAVRLAGTGLDAHTNRTEPPQHGVVTFAQLAPLLERRGMPRKLAQRLAQVTGGHHGLFPDDAMAGRGQSIGEERADVRYNWDRARGELFEELATIVGIGAPPEGSLPNPAAMALAGLITVADWIGSIEETGFFEYEPRGAEGLAAYYERTRDRAAHALRALNWLAYHEPEAPRRFTELFPFEPRPLQRTTEQVRKTVAGGGLVIIEAPMGEGKTEAALHLVDSWAAGGTARGVYIALPTQATANQMHERIEDFLRRRYQTEVAAGERVNLVLAHGGTALVDDLSILPSGVYGDDGPAKDSVGAGEWFLRRKRSLLAPYGVGTIDQALFGVLQVKHVFVRLFGLAGKAVVIDEVHAYDTYMTGLLERLLEWLGALESPVVMLSATLPAGRRERLLSAYHRGRIGSLENTPLKVTETEYPRVTWVEDDEVRSQAFEASERSRRLLEIRRIAEGPGSVVDLLRSELASGGCAAVICNTVARAQEMYVALRAAGFQPGRELGLFHARFLEQDRRRIEKLCLRRFGPPGENFRRPAKYVLVATQVIEQSLDLDFDVMVTDLAPVDLLLQRSGLLLRHDRPNRGQPRKPVLHIRWPEEVDGLPVFDGPSTYVYDEHILLRTWHALREGMAIEIPGDLQGLVDLVYCEGTALPEGELQTMWRKTWEAMEAKRGHEQREARNRRLRTPGGPPDPPSTFITEPRDDDAPNLHPAHQALTRLAGPSVEVVVLEPGDPANASNGTPDMEETKRLLGGRLAFRTLSSSGHSSSGKCRTTGSGRRGLSGGGCWRSGMARTPNCLASPWSTTGNLASALRAGNDWPTLPGPHWCGC